MRLNIEQRVVGSTVHVVISGVIDWSTIAQFRDVLRGLVARPCPDVRMDVSGLISWCPEAQVLLVRSASRARLNGGDLVLSELNAVARWEADGSMLPERSASPRPAYTYRQARSVSALRPGGPMSVGLRLVPPLP